VRVKHTVLAAAGKGVQCASGLSRPPGSGGGNSIVSERKYNADIASSLMRGALSAKGTNPELDRFTASHGEGKYSKF